MKGNWEEKIMQGKNTKQMNRSQEELNRREFLARIAGATVLGVLSGPSAPGQTVGGPLNIARVAVPSSHAIMSENKISALNDGFTPVNSYDRNHGCYALWTTDAAVGVQPWVQYEWSEPISIDKVQVYWAVDRPRPAALPGSSFPRMQQPVSYKILWWNGKDFVPVEKPEGLGVAPDSFNTTTFATVMTSKIRLEVVPEKGMPAGVLEWRVFNHGPVPDLPPVVDAGVDRSVVSNGKTYLSGKAIWLQDSRRNVARWSKQSGPGVVVFQDATSLITTATFSAAGEYVLSLGASGAIDNSRTIQVHVEPKPPKNRLDVVYTRKYSIDSKFWNQRAKALIVKWIPHCIEMCERTDIPAMRGDGGIDNFIEAGKANRGEPHAQHKGFVFSNAWVHQTVESMCIALMVEPRGDAEVARSQDLMRKTLDRWIPIILAAQMPDG